MAETKGASCNNVTAEREKRHSENLQTKIGSEDEKEKLKEKRKEKANEETTVLNVAK